jgi:hypothetical protein
MDPRPARAQPERSPLRRRNPAVLRERDDRAHRKFFARGRKWETTGAVNCAFFYLTLEKFRGRRHPRAGGVSGSTLSQVE